MLERSCRELLKTKCRVRVSRILNRQRPFGKTEWQAEMASLFGLRSTSDRVAGRVTRKK
jgi:hypothetical protein